MSRSRRQLLKTVPVGISGFLAGCNSGGGSPPSRGNESNSPTQSEPTNTEPIPSAASGPPHFERVSIDGPETVTTGEVFTLTVSAANTGGRAGDFTSTLSIGPTQFASEKGIRIPDIEPGTKKETTLGPFVLDSVRTIQFRITDFAVDYAVSSTPSKLPIDSQFETTNWRITIHNTSIRQSYIYNENHIGGGQSTEIAVTGSDKVFLFLDIFIRNVSGEESLTPEKKKFELSTPQSTFTPAGVQQPRDFDHQLYPGLENLAVGESLRVWLPFEIPTSPEPTSLRFAWDTGGDDRNDVIWSFGSGVVSSLQDPPRFEIVEFATPESVEIQREKLASLRLRNTGSVEGSFAGKIERRNVGEDEWNIHEWIDISIPPQSTETVETTVSEPYIGPSEYRVVPSGPRKEIDFVPATLQFGETLVEPSGSSDTADELLLGNKYSYQTHEEKTVSAGQGKQFAFIHLETEIVGGESVELADASYFHVILNGDEYDNFKPSYSNDISAPVSGKYYDPPYLGEPGDTIEGWLVYKIPADATRDDVVFRFDNSYTVIEWSTKG